MWCVVLCCVILYYNLIGPPSYMRPIVGRNVVMRRMTVYLPLLKYIVTRDLRFPDMLRGVD